MKKERFSFKTGYTSVKEVWPVFYDIKQVQINHLSFTHLKLTNRLSGLEVDIRLFVVRQSKVTRLNSVFE